MKCHFSLKYIIVLFCSFSLWLCTDSERTNIYDPESENYVGDATAEMVINFAPDCQAGDSCIAMAQARKDSAEKELSLIMLVITFPDNNDSVGMSSVILTGTISSQFPLALFEINSSPLSVESGAWSHSLELSKGVNNIYLLAEDTAGFQYTDTLTVSYVPGHVDTTGPVIVLNIGPSKVDTTASGHYQLSGKVVDESGVGAFTISGTSVSIAADGGWTHQVSLSSGQNVVALYARDICTAANSTRDTVIIFYNVTADDHTPPSLTYESALPDTVTQASFNVRVKAEDNNGIYMVTVNGQPAVLNGGVYEKSITLNTGQNQILVVANDYSVNRNANTLSNNIYYASFVPLIAFFVPAKDTIKMRDDWYDLPITWAPVSATNKNFTLTSTDTNVVLVQNNKIKAAGVVTTGSRAIILITAAGITGTGSLKYIEITVIE